MRLSMFAGVCVVLFGFAAASSRAGPERAAGPSTAGETVVLKYKSWRTWRLDLPDEQFRKVSGQIRLGDRVFATELEGPALRVDTDGDGETDVKVEGKSGFVPLADGKGFRYAVRLVNQGGWRFAAGGGMVGKIDGVRVTLIDQDGNGSYADYGRDAMILGTSKNACFLSRVVNVNGALRHLDVAEDDKGGLSLRLTPFKGASGTLDLKAKHEAHAKLLSAVVCSDDGSLSFDLARVEDGLRLPAGRYVLRSGKLGLGESVVRFRTGKLEPMDLGKDATLAPTWGGPLAATFAYQRSAGQVTFEPASVRYFGRAGEEYFGWAPFGKSPEFSVVDTKLRKEIAKAIFTGC